jgi:hypothetical protein
MTTTTIYSPEFVHAIKCQLVNRVYQEYTRIIYAQSNDQNEYEIWQGIFERPVIRPLFQYYLGLSSHTSSSLLTQTMNIFSINLTFQEYIDQSINLKTIGAYDYQRFMESMKDPVFYNNLTKKYQKEIDERATKNHVVYVVQLHIRAKMTQFFTEEEIAAMGTVMDLVPIYEYRSQRIENQTNDLWNELENRVLEDIL